MTNISATPPYQSTVPDEVDTEFPTVPLAIILGFLSFGTVLGNSLVCIAIYIHPALHHVTYMSIFSLAVADLMVGSTAMPSYIAKKMVADGTLATVVCDMFRFSYFLTGYASILSLCIISADRLCAIKRPLTYVTTVTRSRVQLVLVLIWIDVLAVSSIPFARWPSDQSDECNFSPTRWWSIMVIISNVIIPFFFIVTCYVIIYLIARTHIRKISKNQSWRRNSVNGKQFCREANEQRANKTIMIVIGVFVISWFPSSIYYFVQTTCPSCFVESFHGVKSLVNALVKILTFSSSFANPLIYCWRSKEFRNAFLRILSRKKRKFSDALTSSFRNNRKRERRDTVTSLSKQRDDEGVTLGSGVKTEETFL